MQYPCLTNTDRKDKKKMAFSPRQMEALMMMFKMNGNQLAHLFSNSPRSDTTHTDCASSTSGSASVTASPAPSEASDASAEGKRKHEKDEAAKLATFLCKNYLKSTKVWEFLYEDQKYMNNDNLSAVLKKIKPTLKQKRQLLLQKQLDYKRRSFFRLIKRRVSSQRDYKKVVSAKGRNWSPGPLAETIDLTKDETGDEQDESTDQEQPVEPPESDTKSKSLQSGDKQKTVKEKTVRRKLAQEFAERMKQRRASNKKHPSRRRKQVSMKARGLTPKRKSNTKKRTNTKRSRKEQSQDTSSPPQAPKSAEPAESVESTSDTKCSFEVGDVVSAKWSGKEENGKWFTGSIRGINENSQTMHIVYEDGDVDKEVPWGHVMILE